MLVVRPLHLRYPRTHHAMALLTEGMVELAEADQLKR